MGMCCKGIRGAGERGEREKREKERVREWKGRVWGKRVRKERQRAEREKKRERYMRVRWAVERENRQLERGKERGRGTDRERNSKGSGDGNKHQVEPRFPQGNEHKERNINIACECNQSVSREYCIMAIAVKWPLVAAAECHYFLLTYFQ